MRYIAAHVTVITVVSAWAERHLRAAIGAGPRIEHLPSGIDHHRFHGDVSGDDVRRRHDLGLGPVVVCVARLIARKGQDQLIRALPRVAAKFPPVKLLIVGDGPDRRRLRRLAERSGAGARVVFTGMVPYEDVASHMAAGDIFAMPCGSRVFGLQEDALPAVFLQAAAVGRAAIAGRAGGSPEAVLHGETGLVVDERSIDAIAEAIESLLASPDATRVMAERARQRVHAEFTWDAMAARLQSLLTEITGAGSQIRP
jgi:phosphatidylinositol alpha-1,6-mannosyltransferase